MNLKIISKDIINTFIILTVFIFLYYNQLKNDEHLFLIGKYTIGKITNIKPMKGGLVYSYYYKVRGKRYTDYRESNRYKEIGDKCYVIFNPKKPKENVILLLLPKVEKSAIAPSKGWDKTQINIDDKDIINAIKGYN